MIKPEQKMPVNDPSYHTLDKRLSLVEQSIGNIEKDITKISDTLDVICKNSAEDSGAKKMRAYIVNGTVTFAMIFTAFELHHLFLK
jgi:hypothetical protein